MKYRVYSKTTSRYITMENNWVITPDGKLKVNEYGNLVDMPHCVAEFLSEDDDEFDGNKMSYSIQTYDSEKVKQCPFCGGEGLVCQQDYDDGDIYYIIQCEKCNARTGEWHNNMGAAIENWNFRLREISEI